jgi:hypothetical protein
MIKGNIGERLYQAEMAPPAAAWDNIALLLDEAEEKNLAPVIPITTPRKRNWLRIALAASVLAFVAMTALWLTERNQKSGATGTAANTPTTTVPQPGNNNPPQDIAGKEAPVIVHDTVYMPGEKVLIPAKPTYIYPPTQNPVMAGNNPVKNNTRSNDNATNAAENNTRNLLGVNNPDNVLAGNNPKLGKAQMVDSNGKVIRNIESYNATDPATIGAPDSRGDKSITNILTRISQTGDGEELDSIINNSPYWKNKVYQWRQKLIKSGFTPSIINHMDIVEMQKLLKEDK